MLSIRTQDRKTLVPYDKQITINDRNTFHMVFDNSEILPLGTYATKERALEVLDEIGVAFNKSQTTYYDYNYDVGLLNYTMPQLSVYQMPNE